MYMYVYIHLSSVDDNSQSARQHKLPVLVKQLLIQIQVFDHIPAYYMYNFQNKQNKHMYMHKLCTLYMYL